MRYADLLETVGYVRAKRNPEVRRLLQALGTDIGRKMIGMDTWVAIIRRHAHRDTVDGRGLAITGIRFPNEVEMIRELGGVLVWIDRPEVTEKIRTGIAARDPLAQHASEHSIGPESFDWVVHNDASLQALELAAYEFQRSWLPTGTQG